MDWGTAADIATTVGVLVALGGLVLSARLTRAGQRIEQEQAEATAARTEAAAALTEEYTRRVVDALETMASREPARLGEAPPRAVRWTMSHHGGDMYLLTNVGGTTAHNVAISADDTLPLLEPPEGVDLRPEEAATFGAAPSFGTVDRTITVHWEDQGGAEHDWRYPLPAKPPNRR